MEYSQNIFYAGTAIQRGVNNLQGNSFMFGCTQDVTLWRRTREDNHNAQDNKFSKEIFVRTIIPVKCKWRTHVERNISGASANLSNNAVVIIPYFEGIANLIKAGDIIALGMHDIDIIVNSDSRDVGMPSATGICGEGELKRLLAPNIITVSSVFYNGELNGINGNSNKIRGNHLKVEGK